MRVFLDFEASSLAKRSYPIEVAWVFEDGRSETFLSRPAEEWTDWDPAAEAIHRISRETLVRDGTSHELVANHMLDVLAGHDLLASAPSWDGKWLSALLRAAGAPRNSLRLRGAGEARRECASEILAPIVAPDRLAAVVGDLLAHTDLPAPEGMPAHRALPDAVEERARWLRVCAAAKALSVELARS